MPFHQSGSNAQANFGTYNDIAGDYSVSGSGGAGAGARGGDIGSHNTSTRNFHNDNSVHQRNNGDNYAGPVHRGDKYGGTFGGSAVVGRGNTNQITNNSKASGQSDDNPSMSEIELTERIRQMKEKLAAKKERERLKRLEEELKRLEAELGEDKDASGS